MSKPTADKLVRAYINIRTARDQLLRDYEGKDAELKGQLELVSNTLMELCKETGLDSFKTPYGTVSKRVSTNYWTNDWGSMYDFILEHEAPHLLQQRIHLSNMKKFLEDHPDTMPMGLNIDNKYTISVTKPRARA